MRDGAWGFGICIKKGGGVCNFKTEEMVGAVGMEVFYASAKGSTRNEIVKGGEK